MSLLEGEKRSGFFAVDVGDVVFSSYVFINNNAEEFMERCSLDGVLVYLKGGVFLCVSIFTCCELMIVYLV